MYKIRHKLFIPGLNKKCSICTTFDGNRDFKVFTNNISYVVTFYNNHEEVFTICFGDKTLKVVVDTKSFPICDECYESVIIFHTQYSQSIEYWSETNVEKLDNQIINESYFMVTDNDDDNVEIVKNPRILQDIWVNFQLEYTVKKQIGCTKNKSVPLFCKMCNIVFTDQENLRNHICSKRKFACVYCFKFFAINRIDLHYRTHQFICYICTKEFYAKECLIKHLQTHKTATFNDETVTRGISSKRKYECELCHKKCTFKANLMKHVKIHRNYHVCSVCLTGFRVIGEFKNHLNSHLLDEN